ncbi:hypothetical protein E2C01_045027 [Portunus trituberculatus]|uniref:Uncharacterized protein n=1 Tax=Portunus trituberculatus TaxID=210409 RepID=A0A5B7FZY7_PORTR|nr:hypothetical protein [Portunus trituberculatus]
MVTIDGSPIPFKLKHKFLGLLLNSPCLNWGYHIQYLAETSLPSLSHRHSTFLIQTYTKLASSPTCHALNSLLFCHGREPLHGPLPYQAHTPFVDRALSFFTTFWYHNHFHIYTNGSRLPDPYHCLEVVSHCLHHHSRTICYQRDSLSTLHIIRFYCPHSHHNLTLIIHHLILHLTSLGHDIHLQLLPSDVGVMGNTMAIRAVAEVHTHPSFIDIATDQTDSLTDLKTACRQHWDTVLTDALQHTSM